MLLLIRWKSMAMDPAEAIRCQFSAWQNCAEHLKGLGLSVVRARGPAPVWALCGGPRGARRARGPAPVWGARGPARARRAREPAEPAGFNLFRPTSFKVFCRNPACSRKTTAYYNPILFHATAKYYSILVYTTTVPDHTRKFFSVLQSNTPYYNCTTP